MERGIFRVLRRALRRLGCRRKNGRFTYSDARVLAVYLWGVLHDRPMSWACDPANWPRGLLRGGLPSGSTISRRMRTASVRRLRERLERAVRRRGGSTLAVCLDGKPLPIGPHSHDRQAGYGRAASGKAKGYKLHAVMSTRGDVLAWRVTPMNTDERVMARRILRDLEHQGYVLADANYDSGKLYALADARGMQLVAPRRRPGTGRGHRPPVPARLRAVRMLENQENPFGGELMKLRWSIERAFGSLSSTAGCLTHLPAWVRTHRRVQNWVAGKLIIYAARRA